LGDAENAPEVRRLSAERDGSIGLDTGGVRSSPINKSCDDGCESVGLKDVELRCLRANAGREGRYFVGELPIGICRLSENDNGLEESFDRSTGEGAFSGRGTGVEGFGSGVNCGLDGSLKFAIAILLGLSGLDAARLNADTLDWENAVSFAGSCNGIRAGFGEGVQLLSNWSNEGNRSSAEREAGGRYDANPVLEAGMRGDNGAACIGGPGLLEMPLS